MIFEEMKQLSLGKIRALQSASTEPGVFAILDVKLSMVKCIGPSATAVLLAPVYSIGQAIAELALPPKTAFLSAIAETYTRPCLERFGPPHVNERWYKEYQTS